MNRCRKMYPKSPRMNDLLVRGVNNNCSEIGSSTGIVFFELNVSSSASTHERLLCWRRRPDNFEWSYCMQRKEWQLQLSWHQNFTQALRLWASFSEDYDILRILSNLLTLVLIAWFYPRPRNCANTDCGPVLAIVMWTLKKAQFIVYSQEPVESLYFWVSIPVLYSKLMSTGIEQPNVGMKHTLILRTAILL